MSRAVQTAALVALRPAQARALWVDTQRWDGFVEGFARVVESRGDWPHEGATVVWESIPGGRGRVTEKVIESSPEAFATRLSEEALQGTQSARFALVEAERTRVDLCIDYELSRPGPLRAVADALFIRRALGEALRRTLHRFVLEAQEEAAHASELRHRPPATR